MKSDSTEKSIDPQNNSQQLNLSHYKTIYKENPIPTYIWKWVGEDFILLDHNAAAYEITKGKIVQYLGISLSKLYKDMPELQDDIFNCYLKKSCFERQMQYKYMSTNEEKFLSVKYFYVQPCFVLVYTVDISQWKAVEQTFKNIENKYNQFIKTSQDGILIARNNPFQILFANQAFSRLIGYSISEIKNTDVFCILNFIHKNDIEIFSQILDNQFSEINKPFHAECRGINKNGSLIWFSITATKINYQSMQCMLILFKDISHQKKTEEALIENEEKFRLIAETSLDLIFQLDLQGIIKYVSPVIETDFGFKPTDVIGRHYETFLSKPESKQSEQVFLKVIQGKKIKNFEISVYDKSKNEIYLEISLTGIVKNGRIVGI